MPGAHGTAIDPNYLRNGSATTIVSESFADRGAASIDLVACLVTQVMTSVAVPLQAGDLVTSISFCSGATAANTPTNYWFALYSSAATPALLAQSADQTSTAWAADAWKTLALSTPQQITASGLYYAAIMVKATAVPTLMGRGVVARLGPNTGISPQKSLCVNSGSALTATAPATIASPTVQGAQPYCVIT